MSSDDVEEFDTMLRAVAASPSIAVLDQRLLGERFRLLRRLGEGGFGVVYEAEDLRDHGRVALKLLRNAEADWLYRFKREFRSLQGILHPGLVLLDELFCDQGRWFFTMEFVDGRSFVESMRVAPTGARPRITFDTADATEPVAEAKRFGTSSSASPAHVTFDERRLRLCLRSLFEVLSVLHAANKVHRDIKPANVLVTREGRVVLIDFGLVTDSFNGNASATVGTPGYMAPEQAASQEVSPAADLYAVGVMLHEAVTGRLPVDGPPLQVLIDKQTYNPISQATLPPDLPEDLRSLCVKLLHVEPAKRPTAAEAWRALAEDGHATTLPERSSTGSPLFVGRVAELEELQRAFVASTRGQLVVVLVSGESGIGKSHLVRRFAKRLQQERPEVMVLEGRCHEREAVPYKTLDGVVDALSRRLSALPGAEVAALLPTQRAMLARIFPVMLRIPQLAREFAKADGDPQSTRQRAFSALRDLFSRIALDRPTVIAVDDLQWTDEDGMKALVEVLRPPDAPPLLFVGTVRARAGDAVRERIRALLPGEVRVIELTNLGDQDARELAHELLRRAGASWVDSQRIATDASGHPLFVEELARHAALGAAVAGETRLDDAIWARVTQLPQAAREIAELAAVAGKPVPQQVAAAAAHLEPGAFQRGTAVLRASNLVRTSGARWEDAIEPYHDRIREAMLARLTPSRRAALHEALAIAFEAASSSDSETLAVHWREAGNFNRAAAYADAAGDQAS
jgi:eukaryotic-like serine/threonine-protein kinase